MFRMMFQTVVSVLVLAVFVGSLSTVVKNNGWLQGEPYNEHVWNSDLPEAVIKRQSEELEIKIAAVREDHRLRGALDKRDRGSVIPEELVHKTECEFDRN